jgi:Icc-related predicted phosphoesterase
MSVQNKPVYRKLHPLDTRRFHQQAIKFIADTVDANPMEQYIVVTHHAPHFNSIHPTYKDDFPLNHAFYTDLTTFICARPQIVLWAHGHIHHACDYHVPGSNTRVVCNPVGYPPSLTKEITNYNCDFVLTLPFSL